MDNFAATVTESELRLQELWEQINTVETALSRKNKVDAHGALIAPSEWPERRRELIVQKNKLVAEYRSLKAYLERTKTGTTSEALGIIRKLYDIAAQSSVRHPGDDRALYQANSYLRRNGISVPPVRVLPLSRPSRGVHYRSAANGHARQAATRRY